MEQGILKKTELKKLVNALAKDAAVFAPVKEDGDIVLAEVASADDVVLDFYNTKLSPKNVFFPPCEVICTFRGDAVENVPVSKDKRVLFGIRPCDARALAQMDKVFESADIRDPYYLERRKNTVVIALACTEPLDTCFCTAVGGDPSSKEGADVLVSDVDGSFLFEACSDHGTKFMKTHGTLFKKPDKAALAKKEKQEAQAREKVAAVATEGLTEKLRGSFESPVWDAIAERCLGCGICTSFCPTCHCFDITDETKDGTGRRIRTWDSCQYSLFTYHASGHNPRPSKKERMRQRLMHKFSYAPENFDETFCVGCGRCVRNCPVNLDVREAIASLTS